MKAALKRAKANGYLTVGPDTDDELRQAWWQQCREEGRLFSLEVERVPGHPCQVTLRTLKGRLSVQVLGELSLVTAVFGSTDSGAPDCLVWEVERRHLATAVEMVSRVMGHERLRVEMNAAFFPVEGLAVCIDNEGMEHLLRLGETVYIRELPNMRGHCLILAEGRTPIIGWHLERFRMATADTLPRRRRHHEAAPTPWPSQHLYVIELDGRWRCIEGKAPS